MSNPYDEAPHPSLPYPKSHPVHLATVAKLFGLEPPGVSGSRVLELGCARGGNLLPMSETLPGCRLLGIDSSARQVSEATDVIRAVGLENVEVRCTDILDVGEDFGCFDYIICHGVYSWVPEPVRDKILRICKANLAPQGIAYVSYNTYPGWHMRETIRDAMVYHVSRLPDAATKVRQARALLEFLCESVPADGGPYSALLAKELATLREQPDAYLLHEHLEADNAPLYFHQFSERCERVGLAYVGDSDIGKMWAGGFGPEVTKILRKLGGNVIQLEQYMDFLRNRTFRRTLLCHQGHEVRHALGSDCLDAMCVSSQLDPVEATLDLASSSRSDFRQPNGVGVSTSDPIVKAALVVLRAIWPEAMGFETLLSAARSHLGRDSAAGARPAELDRRTLALDLLNCFLAGAVEVSAHPPDVSATAPSHPATTRLARHQARSGPFVTNLKHQSVKLGYADRVVLAHLDGSCDREGLVDALHEWCARGALVVSRAGEKIDPDEVERDALAAVVGPSLRRLAYGGLLRGLPDRE